MSAIKARIERLEAVASSTCRLCFLVAPLLGVRDAAGFARHAPHTLDQIVAASYRTDAGEVPDAQ